MNQQESNQQRINQLQLLYIHFQTMLSNYEEMDPVEYEAIVNMLEVILELIEQHQAE